MPLFLLGEFALPGRLQPIRLAPAFETRELFSRWRPAYAAHDLISTWLDASTNIIPIPKITGSRKGRREIPLFFGLHQLIIGLYFTINLLINHAGYFYDVCAQSIDAAFIKKITQNTHGY